MASDKDYLTFVLEQLPDGVSSRPMMGEFLLYYRGKLFGGIYDDRFLVKPTAAALAQGTAAEIPYPGAKPMVLIENTDNREALADLLEAMYSELPAPKRKGV